MKDYSPTSAPWQAYKESLEQLILGPGVTHIGEYAFTNCENLTGNLFLSEVLTSIGRYAFYKCNFYGHLIIPNSVTTIGNSAFRDCKAFSGLSLSNNLSKIESSVFDGCSGFTGNLVIPSSVTSIENSAFSYCSNFTGDLVIPDSVTNIGNNAFAFWGKSRGKLILPSELKSVPDGCFYMSGFTGDLFLPQTVTLIGSYAFGENKFTGELKLPGKLKLISKSAFAGCEYLSGKVVLPESVESIGDSIFSRCSRLNGIVILNRECNIAGGESAIPANFNIYGYAASTAQDYATTYGRTFIKDHDYICTEKKATCTEGGLKTYTCSICGDMYTEETSELKHSYSTKWTVDKAATCTEKGSQSRHCTRCNEKTDITEIAELGHTYGEPKFIWSEDNAICNAEFICTTCGNIEELSCAITEDIKAATCTEVGERIYTATCTHNNQVYRSEKKVNIPAEGHTYGEPQFIWSEDNTTCNAEVICSTCDNVESLNCEVSTDVPDITCTEGGEIVYTATCIYENKEYTDEKKVIAPSNGHTYGAPKFEWSEDHQTCIAVFECVVGDDKQQEDCQVNSKVTIAPTCEKNGIRTYTATCTFNGKEYSDSNTEEILAIGHNYGAPQFVWIGNNECSAKFTCSVCGDVQKVKCTISANKTIDATCTKAGQTVYTSACKFGGNNKEEEYIDTKAVNNAALGHKFGQPTFSWSEVNTCKATSKCDSCKESITKKCTVTNKVKKEATCKDNGVIVYTAVYRGEDGKEYTSTKEVKTSVKDHKYEYTNNEDGTHTVVCTVGGEKKTEQCSYKDKVCTKCGSRQKTTNLPYKDVKQGEWYYEAVTYVYDNGIMTGFADGSFGPAGRLGRGQFATILYRMEGSPNTKYQTIFPDVSNGLFYSIPASWAYNTGVISGYNSGYFGPTDAMTREQLATMMYRYAKYKGYNIAQKANLEKYPDYKKVSSFSNEAMQWAVGVGLISGDQGKLNPQGTASRAVTSIIIQRFMKAYQ